MRYDFGRLLYGLRGLMGPMIEAMPFPLSDFSLAINAWGGIDGRVWRGTLGLDLVEFGKMTRSMNAAQARVAAHAEAKAGMFAIVEALASYAVDHAGKYPETLEALIKPDANGKAYIAGAENLLDPWGNPYHYEAPTSERPKLRLCSFGKDGKPGGEGEDADIDSAGD